jgi:hypothetical protein
MQQRSAVSKGRAEACLPVAALQRLPRWEAQPQQGALHRAQPPQQWMQRPPLRQQQPQLQVLPA